MGSGTLYREAELQHEYFKPYCLQLIIHVILSQRALAKSLNGRAALTIFYKVQDWMCLKSTSASEGSPRGETEEEDWVKKTVSSDNDFWQKLQPRIQAAVMSEKITRPDLDYPGLLEQRKTALQKLHPF
ncbi:hypothetical protein BX616_010510 [Lobosporangium transversale]|uniref:Uncharacterized protein n=1 Tax=Lobosporangium transversale TaxID=64571 RepID=A0A1Y2GG52_9FUNG|nr:hypothetical protein BCR41DRAFT_372809 [Lobosporangium transversale]KAF9918039.1 hypothetical protein BX616_010510 [Lobosporangium transversale]ORZ09780.1 hypothetical protein BCR41DRAFT_372809 [Lobosporangium transversale]|eukprot:XP_021879050.1 hypothetical protein BCR41DRAFT_372809 [Lobosporangium transversale]